MRTFRRSLKASKDTVNTTKKQLSTKAKLSIRQYCNLAYKSTGLQRPGLLFSYTQKVRILNKSLRSKIKRNNIRSHVKKATVKGYRTFLIFNSGRFLLPIFLLTLLMTACSNSDDQNEERSSKGRTLEYSREVTFLNVDGETITTIEVAVADEDNERNMGLMDVDDLPADKGMLFIFDEQQPLSFWMANTPLSLDIFFINESLEIVRIHQNTQPFSDKNLTSGEPALYVVETNAGFSLSHDIQEGMSIEFGDLEE